MNNNVDKKRNYAKFAILSLLGFFIFLCPVPDFYTGGSTTLIIGIITTWFHDTLGPLAQYITMLMAAVSFIGTVVVSLVCPAKFSKESMIYELFYAKKLNLIARLAGSVLLLMVAFNIGPEMLLNPNVGGTMLGLCVIVGIELIPAIILMPLLVEFGLMEFLGTLVNKMIRPLFRLPGRSSVDLLASWVGMVELGLIVTDDQYARGYYTEREATSIATCFTATGVAFWLVCGEMTGVTEGYLIPFFAAIFLVGFIVAVITVRLAPLSKLPDKYMVTNENNIDPVDSRPSGQSLVSYSCQLGAEKAASTAGIAGTVKKIIQQNLMILLTLVPIVMIIGVISLAIAEYTPILTWVGYPFGLILQVAGVPGAFEGGAAIASGFFDMFLPVVLIAESASIQLRFIVTVVALTQIVFISEVISFLLNSRIPIKFRDMVIIFIERTVIAMLVLIPFTYLLGIVD